MCAHLVSHGVYDGRYDSRNATISTVGQYKEIKSNQAKAQKGKGRCIDIIHHIHSNLLGWACILLFASSNFVFRVPQRTQAVFVTAGIVVVVVVVVAVAVIRKEQWRVLLLLLL